MPIRNSRDSEGLFEHHHEPLIPRQAFLRRMARFTALAFGLIGASLFIGMLGYRLTEGMSWLDAFLNAAMLLGGMGPVNPLHTAGGKLFAGLYAMFSGLVLLVSAGVMIAPLFHRFLHRFHLDLEESDDGPKG
jgi:hypothetical protein